MGDPKEEEPETNVGSEEAPEPGSTLPEDEQEDGGDETDDDE